MGKKLPPKQLELYRRIDEILFYKWDPIGVSDLGYWSRDEYHSYLPKIFRLTLDHDSPRPVAEYLTLISTEFMGLRRDVELDMKAAALIFAIKEGCLD